MARLIGAVAAAASIGIGVAPFQRELPSLIRDIGFPPPVVEGRFPQWDMAAIQAWRTARSNRDMGRQIPLTRGQVAIVDERDYAELSRYRWFAVPQRKGRAKFYAARLGPDGRRIWMHRAILDAPEGELVDHRDGDGLNNRRGNLRLATTQQNIWNRAVGCAHYRGVRQVASGWSAAIYVDGQRRSLGVYPTPEAAARAYDAAAKAERGAFAVLNFPRDCPSDLAGKGASDFTNRGQPQATAKARRLRTSS